ncbi:phage minor head protein [Halomonas sp. JS92-SW72]|uniref:phage head morphogenesis protein n=1 Tax=Halomonas sp. JS92-SW72 TaxID=2306583 RepID=UPI000E5BD98D|nr:phage minor head protein [Halomonas sp. JS92-SW72]AXY41607.1 hypothetical protein D1793_05010 [Halomonas sp. JS92-SW72]
MTTPQQPSAVSGTFRRPFAEQVAFFRARLANLLPTERWDDIERQAHDAAFVVAGATKASLLADLAAAVDRSISEGQSLEQFRRDFRDTVERRGWHNWTGEGSLAGEAWRTRVIYTTNARTSYAAGRRAQIREGGFAFRVYRHGGSAEPRPEHLGWDGLTLPADHEFWESHAPPNGWGCSCYELGARSEEGAQRLGGNPSKRLPADWSATDQRTGAPPGIDRGWDYAPGDSVQDAVRAGTETLSRLPAALSAAAIRDWQRRDIQAPGLMEDDDV